MMTASPIVEAGHVSLPVAAPWLRALLDELAQFPEGVYKDQADAFSQLLNWNHRRLHHGARAERRGMFADPKKPRSWEW